MSEKHPSRSEPSAELVDLCRARFLTLADRLQAVEDEARAELREVTAALGEPGGSGSRRGDLSVYGKEIDSSPMRL